MFFKKKEKVKDPNKKKGCLRNLIIGIVLLVIFGVATVFAVKDTLKIYGVSLGMFNEYVGWLNEEVDETKLTTNAIRENDLVTFNQKANESGLDIYDNNGKINFNIPALSLDSTITLYDYEVGAMINSAMENSTTDTTVFRLLELTITPLDDDNYQLKTVVKLDITDIKKSIGKNANKLPNNIYLTSVGNINAVGSRVQTNNNTVRINQLSDDKNEKILSLIKNVSESNPDEEISDIADVNNYIVTEVLTSLAQKTGSKPKLASHTISFIVE